MFKAFKDKLKGALGAFSKKVKEEAEEVEPKEEKKETPKKEPSKKKPAKPAVKKPKKEVKTEKEIEKDVEEEVKEITEKEEKKGFFKKLLRKKDDEVKEIEDNIFEHQKEREKKLEKEAEEIIEKSEEKKGFLSKVTEKITQVELSADKFENLFDPLEIVLLENNVALEVVEKIKDDLKNDLVGNKIPRREVDSFVLSSLKSSVESLFDVQGPDLLKLIKEKKEKPYVIAMIGVNGAGKTTTMAKIAHMLMENKLSVVFAASDTFRAASIEQLEEHAKKLNVKVIKHDYQSDPAAVAFDAVEHAKAKKIDVVLIDTAGRLHSNTNLMEELKKVVRVNNPDLKIFIGESTTGNDCVEQAREFNDAVGIDVIVLSKADIDEKGGAAISISFVTGKPIIYLGTGQTYDDLKKFEKDIIIKNLF